MLLRSGSFHSRMRARVSCGRGSVRRVRGALHFRKQLHADVLPPAPPSSLVARRRPRLRRSYYDITFITIVNLLYCT